MQLWDLTEKENGSLTYCLFSGVVDRSTTNCLPLHYIYLGCPSGYLHCQQIFSITSKLSYYFYIVKQIYKVSGPALGATAQRCSL
jgi:hypothetical protein